MKLWIDDVRPAPEGYIWVKSVNETWDIINSCYARDFFEDEIECIEISLDHDASNKYFNYGGDYIEILNKLEYCANTSVDWDQYIRKYIVFHIHSANPVGVENMRRIIRKNGWKEI